METSPGLLMKVNMDVSMRRATNMITIMKSRRGRF
jgi:hypothetical protein